MRKNSLFPDSFSPKGRSDHAVYNDRQGDPQNACNRDLYRHARELGERVLAQTARYGNGLLGLYHISVKDLQKIEGIGKVKAVQLKAIAEFARRMARAKAKNGLSFHDPYSVADYYMERFRHENVEYILLLLLDSGYHSQMHCLPR